MAEMLKRVLLPRGKQRGFIDSAIQKCGDVSSLAKTLGVSPRTIRDWRREKFLMSSRSANILKNKFGLELPREAKLRDEFWYVTKGARRGGLTSYKKQGGQVGDPRIRLQKWREWWEKEGKFKEWRIFHSLPFRIPEKSVNLAEFVGIMMGDGGMSDNQLSITLHHLDDLEFSKYVVKLIKTLFAVEPSIYHEKEKSVNRIIVSRTGLVKHLNSLGLPIGNKVKQEFDIPDWVKNNKLYLTACAKGLIDTDGCIFTHRYRVNGKRYEYKKLAFTSLSKPLILSVHQFLKKIGLHPRLSQNRDVRLDSILDMQKYFSLIGSRNPKHLKKYSSVI